jgi:hypothetical protein
MPLYLFGQNCDPNDIEFYQAKTKDELLEFLVPGDSRIERRFIAQDCFILRVPRKYLKKGV